MLDQTDVDAFYKLLHLYDTGHWTLDTGHGTLDTGQFI